MSSEAKDLISKLLCNVNQRLGSKGADEIKVLYGVSCSMFLDLFWKCFKNRVNYLFALLFQAHPWFKGVEWDRLYDMEAAFIPEVNDELDTQNFEKFDEVNMLFINSYLRSNYRASFSAVYAYLFPSLYCHTV